MPNGLNPVHKAEFNAMMDPLGPYETRPEIAVALSGGCDSMALLLLAQEWASAHQGKVVALTVDHGLRKESEQEAQQVGQWCEQLGIEHHILSLNLPTLRSAIQATARDARYRLLTAFCRERGILNLMTAHHRDDQAETFFFRLARGSNIGGLAGMAAVSDLSGIRLLRPLLSLSKDRLADTMSARDHPWIEDLSNHEPLYTRNIVRQNIALLPDAESISEQAGNLAKKFAAARNLLEYKLAIRLTLSLEIYPEGYGILLKDPFLDSPSELALATLSAAAMTLSGETSIPRSEQVERLYEALAAGQEKRTFSGLIFEWKDSIGGWLIAREPEAIEGEVDVPPGEDAVWDNRFMMRWYNAGADIPPLTVDAVGAVGMKNLLTQEPMFFKQNPLAKTKIVLASLPAFWHLEEMIAIPHIKYVASAYRDLTFTARYMPVKPLAGRGFFSPTS